jgi:hypothetical protein
VNRSTITQMESYVRGVRGRPTTKSTWSPHAGKRFHEVGEELCIGRTREVELSPFPLPPSLEDPDRGGLSSPALLPPVRWRTGLVPSLSPRPRFLVADKLHLQPCHILRQVGISRFIVAALKTLCQAASTMKRSNRISRQNGTERTNPGVGNPFLQRGRASSGARIDPKIQASMDPGVNFYCAQLIGGGMVGATLPRIQPHLGLSPPEELDPVTKKCLQEVHPY